jgi:hypothetical protein
VTLPDAPEAISAAVVRYAGRTSLLPGEGRDLRSSPHFFCDPCLRSRAIPSVQAVLRAQRSGCNGAFVSTVPRWIRADRPRRHPQPSSNAEFNELVPPALGLLTQTDPYKLPIKAAEQRPTIEDQTVQHQFIESALPPHRWSRS